MTTTSGRRVLLLIGTKKGLVVYTSDEARTQWQVHGPFLSGWSVDCMHVDTHEGEIFVGTSHRAYGSTVRVSRDFGETWRQLSPGPHFPPGRGYKLKSVWTIVGGGAASPDRMFVGVDEAGLFRSDDRGETWSELSALVDQPTRSNWRPGRAGLSVHSILTHPEDPQRIWVAIAAVGVFRTDDGGRHWHPCHKGLQHPQGETGAPADYGYQAIRLAHTPSDPERLYLQTHQGTFRSIDGGSTWTPLMTGLPSHFGFPLAVSGSGDVFTVPLAGAGERYMKDGRFAVYRLRSGSDAWQPCHRGLPSDPYYVSVLRGALDVDPLSPAGVYMGTSSGEVFYSSDSGDTWQALPGTYDRISAVRAFVH